MGSTEPVWRVLNLGCGLRTWDSLGVLNVDLTKHSPEVDEAWNLNDVPWPWRDGSFDEVCARSVFEHLDLPLLTSVNECWRVLRLGGLLDIKLPYWNAEVSYNDLTHRWHKVGCGVFDQLDPRHRREHQYWFYTDRKWLIMNVGLNQGATSVCARLRKISASEADAVRRAWKTGEDQAHFGLIIARWLAAPTDRRTLSQYLEA